MKKIFSAFILFFCFCITALAAPSPIDMLKSTSDQVLAQLRQNHASLKNDPSITRGIITNILLPHIDIEGMARASIGRTWNEATPTQRQQFQQQFTTLLVRTYAAAFANYKDEDVQFLPIRGDISGQSQVQVKSLILQNNGPSIPVDYRLMLKGQDWKVTDFSVDGISMIASFRSQFAPQLNQGGIDNLIKVLAGHNNKT